MRNLNSIVAPEGRAGGRNRAWLCGLLAAASLLAAGLSQAQSAPAASASAPPQDTSITWHGITLYGIVDVGFQYDTHAAPFSDYFMAGSADVVQKNSNNVGVRNYVEQLEPVPGRPAGQGVAAVSWIGRRYSSSRRFSIQHPGTSAMRLKSLAQNNGKPLTAAKHQHRFECSGAGVPAVLRGIELAHLRHDHLRAPKHAHGGRHLEV